MRTFQVTLLKTFLEFTSLREHNLLLNGIDKKICVCMYDLIILIMFPGSILIQNLFDRV